MIWAKAVSTQPWPKDLLILRHGYRTLLDLDAKQRWPITKPEDIRKMSYFSLVSETR